MKRTVQPAALTRRKERVWQVQASLVVITPVFGGGVESGTSHDPHLKEIDNVTPVRSAAIRAQLRYWWRACCGTTYDSVQEMWEREAYLFGVAAGLDEDTVRGALSLWVRQEQTSDLRSVPVYESGTVAPLGNQQGFAYAAFPLRPAEGSRNTRSGELTSLDDGRWTLHLRYTTENIDRWVVDIEELKLALSATLLFGNVGGRGSRGFGQLGAKVDDTYGLFSTIENFIEELDRYQKGKAQLSNVPSVTPESFYLTKTSRSEPGEMLEHALKELWEFRQLSSVGRDGKKGDTVPGASRWPEAQYIRNLTGDRSLTRNRKLEEGGHSIKSPAAKVPRAVFGLPIQMQFKDVKAKNGYEPSGTTTFQPEGAKRFPSLLRIAIVPEGEGFRALGIKMHNDVPKIAISISDGSQSVSASHDLTQEELQNVRNRGLRALTSTDVVAAFMAHLGASKIIDERS